MSYVPPRSLLRAKNKFFFFLGFCVSPRHTNRATRRTVLRVNVALLHEPGSGETGRHASGSEMS